MNMDDNLKHICAELCLLSKKKRLLINDEYGIRNLDDLLQLESRLENGELVSMDVDIKKKLMVAAEWVRKNPGVVVSEHFCSDVWDDWVKSCESNEDGMDAEMTKICDAIGLREYSRSQMVEYGITSVDALHKVEVRASNYELTELRSDITQNLTFVSEWLRDNPSFDIRGKFDESLYWQIITPHYSAQFYIDRCLGSPFKEENLKPYVEVESTPGLLDLVINKVIAAVTTKMPRKLKDYCGNFDYKFFIGMVVLDLHYRVGKEDYVGGKYVVTPPMRSGGYHMDMMLLDMMASLFEIESYVLTDRVDVIIP